MGANGPKNIRLRTVHSFCRSIRNSLLGQLEAQSLLVHGLQRPRTQDFADLECTSENTPRSEFILVDFSGIDLGVALIKYLVTNCFAMIFIRPRQAASLSVRPRCLVFTPVSERSRFPAASLSCHVFAARQRATYRGCGACVSSLSCCLALRRSDPRRPMKSKSSVAKLTAPAGIHRGQAAPTGNYRVKGLRGEDSAANKRQ